MGTHHQIPLRGPGRTVNQLRRFYGAERERQRRNAAARARAAQAAIATIAVALAAAYAPAPAAMAPAAWHWASVADLHTTAMVVAACLSW